MRYVNLLMVVMALGILMAHAQGIPKELKNILQKAYRDGAKAKLTFRVTDSLGNPVTNADVRTGFYVWDEEKSNVASTKTDTNGMCTVEGLCSVDANCSFTKDGYYKTNFRHTFPNPRREPDSVKDGKWQPWNPTIEVTLKEKRNPVAMYVNRIEVYFPQNELVGFDCKQGDLVAPYGTGNESDFLFTVIETSKSRNEFQRQLVVVSDCEDGGFIRSRKDIWSSLVSKHEAPDNGYTPKVETIFVYGENQQPIDTRIGEDEYLMFRSRVKKDDKGKITYSNYGKIDGRIKSGKSDKGDNAGYVQFLYYFNPTPNDRNLEFDTSKNLFGDNSRNRIEIP